MSFKDIDEWIQPTGCNPPSLNNRSKHGFAAFKELDEDGKKRNQWNFERTVYYCETACRRIQRIVIEGKKVFVEKPYDNRCGIYGYCNELQIRRKTCVF